MKKSLQIGVTGGIGTGKSLVCRIFHCLGAPVYDADSRAKKLMTEDQLLKEQIRLEFGGQSYFQDGRINREFLAGQVFGSPEQLVKLNRLVHPRVLLDYASWAASFPEKHYVIKEAAILFESGSASGLDAVILVTAPESLRIKRVLQRDTHRTAQDIRNIMGRQLAEKEKMKQADYILVNDETTLLIPQVIGLHRRFTWES